jgi:hypothetical protein
VEGSAPSKTKEETINNSLRAMDIGSLTTFGTSTFTDQRKVLINLEHLAPYETTTQKGSLKEGTVGE